MTHQKSKQYDFIVTGASGNIGRHLIPLLGDQGYSILALGRDASALRTMYAKHPQVDCADYEALPGQEICDTLIHLAVRNNDQPGTLEDFTRANVDFTNAVCAHFMRMNGRRFINISSVQALDDSNDSPYAVSKRLAQRNLSASLGAGLDTVYIGYFYDESFFGKKLGILNQLGIFGRALFGLFKTLKPTTSAQSLAVYVANPENDLPKPKILTDDLLRSCLYRGVTRAVDVLAAMAILILLLPMILVLWLVIRLGSPGPAIFAQTRVGKGQVPFTLYKFRTMKRDTASVGTHEVSVSAVTKAGKFLRRTKLDELPQAVNLLRGEMTLVGPRPCLPVQQELVNARSTLGIFSMKPGITGYAQVREIDMSRPQELARSDYVYMKVQSLAINFTLILQTAFGRGRGDRIVSGEAPQG
ncbi:sugar transferase [Sphingomonas sp. PL-96]|nr:sugar transferase [Sphingomonas sp. PL-96]